MMSAWTFEPARDLGLPLRQRLCSVTRESGLIESIGHFAWWAGVRAYLRACHRLTVEGIDNIPREPPFILAANHASHLDALVLASRLCWRVYDRTYPIAAEDTFFDTPARAAFSAGALNALPMRRRCAAPRALQELRRRILHERCVYVMFPEGTRSRDGSIGTFRAGIGAIVAGTEIPVVPCHIHGAFDALPPDRRWPRFVTISLRVGRVMQFADVANDRRGWDRISRELERRVRALAEVSSRSAAEKPSIPARPVSSCIAAAPCPAASEAVSSRAGIARQ